MVSGANKMNSEVEVPNKVASENIQDAAVKQYHTSISVKEKVFFHV